MAKKLRKIEYDGPTWRRRLGELAQINLNIRVCPECGSPRVDGFVCDFCGSDQ